jgi:hypothetical protein
MTSERLSQHELVTRYRTFLRHEPQRFARMLPHEEAQWRREKYHYVDGTLTNEMIAHQLEGKVSFAMLWEANGLASVLLDVDSGGLPAIPALLAECQRRGLWASSQRQLPKSHQRRVASITSCLAFSKLKRSFGTVARICSA